MAATPDAGTGLLSSASGFYIATGRWLDLEFGPGQLHKVGHTSDLGRRLFDDAYVTNFPEGHWRYAATFETGSKDEAFLLETAVLHCCRHRRLGARELVRLPAGEIASLAEALAAELGLTVTRRERPEYAAGRRAQALAHGEAVNAEEGPWAPPSAGAPPAREPSAWAAAKPAVERFTVAPLVAPASAAAAPDLADLVDDILSWDFSGLAAPVPAPVPAPAPESALAPASDPGEPTPQEPSLAPEVKGEKAEDLVAGELDDTALEAELSEAAAASPYDVGAGSAPLEARGYQREATALCVAELRANERTILQMACRCGKTPVAYGVIREFLQTPPAAGERGAGPGGAGAAPEGGGPACALFLVPGLSLLRQTAQKLARYGFADPILLVGSDPREVPLADGRALLMTTEPAVIRAFVAAAGRRLVVSTYQSSPLVPADAFALTVFDECHRVCGGAAPRPFNHHVLAPRAGARLFMTATPAYDPPSKAAVTMKDRALFGGVAYRYHLRQGIAAGHVNDFRLEIVAAPAGAAGAGGASRGAEEEAAIPGQILAAMAKVDKLLVFCRDIRHATRICEALRGAPLPPGTPPFETLVAHSRMGPGGAAAALRRFAEPGVRAALCNVRLFQEGVEIPALNGVFFAAPRHSPRDIIQSVCRPLNHAEGKPPSVIFLPVLHDPRRQPEDPANLKRYASIVPFVDALLAEDPRFYEHLLDPAGTPYPLGVLGTHSLALASECSRAALLGAVRRAVRYNASTAARPVERLLRVENVPWDRAFAEIRRVVLECNRYPKTTDAWRIGDAKVCLHRFYRWAADEYVEFRAGRPSKLEPHQVHDLSQLPEWDRFGIFGPYPWRLCMDFLEQWLADHGGVPPEIEVNVGGYVGLEATMMERLSGALTCINQGDGKNRKGRPPGSGFTVSPEKQADLDAICAKYDLRWRKERDASGALIKDSPQTFIQEAYSRFKAYYKTHGPEGEYIQMWFPGFPQKHRRQENLEVQAAGTAPPRWRSGRRRKADEGP